MDILTHVAPATALEISKTSGPLTDIQLHQLARHTVKTCGLGNGTYSDSVLTSIAQGAQLLTGRFAKAETTGKLVSLLRQYLEGKDKL